MRTIEAVRRSGIGIGPERAIHEIAAVMERAGLGTLAYRSPSGGQTR